VIADRTAYHVLYTSKQNSIKPVLVTVTSPWRTGTHDPIQRV